jgi:hypothetical protein
MIWLQAGICFLLWVAYGVWLRRYSERIRLTMHGRSRTVRTLIGSVGLLGGLAILAFGLYAVYSLGGVQDGVLTMLGLLAVGLIGLVFVHVQVLGAAAMITLVLDEETSRSSKASISSEIKHS